MFYHESIVCIHRITVTPRPETLLELYASMLDNNLCCVMTRYASIIILGLKTYWVVEYYCTVTVSHD